MDRDAFEKIVQQSFELLPEKFSQELDNVSIVIEDYPGEETVKKMRLRNKHQLLGLYQGIPRSERGTWYGMSPVVPDVISLYQRNIEAVCPNDEMVVEKIREVLIHEIGHYFGMDEDEVRKAGY